MLGTQLLDVVFVPLFLLGVETIDTAAGYGEGVIHADYTHSLLGALLIALLAGIWAGKSWGKRSGLTIASVVFSHWVLDLLVHRVDLPILPGNLGHLPLLGLALWKFPAVSITLEGMLIVGGFILYLRSALSRAGHSNKSRAITASIVMGFLLIASLLTDVLGIGS